MKFLIENDTITCIDRSIVRAKSINWYIIEFLFSSEWDDLDKKMVFLNENGEAYEKDIHENKTVLPNIDGGVYDVGVVGYKVENEKVVKRVSTNLLRLNITKSGAEINGEIPIDEEDWEDKVVGITEITEVIEGKNHILTIHLSNGKTFDFTIKDGEKGEQGEPGTVDYDAINSYIDSKILNTIDEALRGDY